MKGNIEDRLMINPDRYTLLHLLPLFFIIDNNADMLGMEPECKYM